MSVVIRYGVSMQCSFNGCVYQSRGSGKRGGPILCGTHYARFRRTGSASQIKRYVFRDIPKFSESDKGYLACYFDLNGVVYSSPIPGRMKVVFYACKRSQLNHISNLLGIKVWSGPSKRSFGVAIHQRYCREIMKQLLPNMKNLYRIERLKEALNKCSEEGFN